MRMPRTIAIWAGLVGLVATAPVMGQGGDVIPQLSGVWDGGPGSRPINGPNMPWTADNFPVLNERGLAFQEVFDEAISPKYDCVPSTPPASQAHS